MIPFKLPKSWSIIPARDKMATPWPTEKARLQQERSENDFRLANWQLRVEKQNKPTAIKQSWSSRAFSKIYDYILWG